MVNITVKLPYDIAAESGVISTVLEHPDFILHSEYLKPRYFYKKENGCIYWAVQELYKKGVDKIDAFNLTTMINSDKNVKGVLDSVNIPSIEEFMNLTKNIARNSIEEYKLLVNKVIALSFKRQLYFELSKIQNVCLDEKDTDLNKLNKTVYDNINKITEEYIATENIELFGNKIDSLWTSICSRRGENGVYGIPTRYSLLNNYFVFEPAELILFKARMKRGKSAWMMVEALHKLKNGIPTAYFDSEMSDTLFFTRMLASLTKIPINKIKSGDYSTTEEQLLKDTMGWIKKQPFVHIYDPVWNNDKIYTTCKILKYKINLGFLVFDYIKSNEKDANEQYNMLGQKCDFLKNSIAGGLNIPVLAGCQLNRKGETADSDKLDRYCSVSVLWREKTSEEMVNDGEDCGNYALTVNLNRIGDFMMDDDYLDFVFDGSTMSIEEAPKQHVKDEPEFMK